MAIGDKLHVIPDSQFRDLSVVVDENGNVLATAKGETAALIKNLNDLYTSSLEVYRRWASVERDHSPTSVLGQLGSALARIESFSNSKDKKQG